MMTGIFKPKAQGKTPYEEAQGAFNEMYASYVKAAHQWRMVALGSIAISIIAVGGLAYLASQHKVVPYAIEFNDHFEAVRVTRADEMERPNSNQIRAALRNWLIGARTVFIDRRAQQSVIKSTYAMTMPESLALSSLSAYHLEHNPYQLSEKQTVEVVVNDVRAISDRTWRIEWTETTKSVSGRTIDTKAWNGAFTVGIVPPTEESQIFFNPTGMYVKEFSWGQRQ